MWIPAPINSSNRSTVHSNSHVGFVVITIFLCPKKCKGPVIDYGVSGGGGGYKTGRGQVRFYPYKKMGRKKF